MVDWINLRLLVLPKRFITQIFFDVATTSMDSYFKHLAVSVIKIYGYEILSLRVEDIRRLLIFHQRCLGSIAQAFWDHGVNNTCVRERILCKDVKSVDKVVNLRQLSWLEYVLRMLNQRLLRQEVYFWCRTRLEESLSHKKQEKVISKIYKWCSCSIGLHSFLWYLP